MDERIEEFLKQSNAIERVYDDGSLTQAKYAWEYLIEQETLVPGIILKTHKILMLHQRLLPNERGYFRTVPVYIGGKEAMDSALIRDNIVDWCVKGTKKKIDTKTLHVEFEKIHPFVDGNGRIGRMLMNWQRIKITKEPVLIIHEGEEQLEYYKWFKTS